MANNIEEKQMFLKAKSQLVCYAPIDLKKADIYVRDGYSNGTNTPTTTAIEPVTETDIALSNMDSAVPDPAVSTGVSVKFGSDTQEYTVTARTLGGGTNEIQSVEIDDDVNTGNFTLTYAGYTTGSIPYNASAAVVEAALEALNSVGLGAVSVSGTAPIWVVTFQGTLASTDVALMTGTDVDMGGGSAVDVELTETVAGVDAVDEIQILTATVALTVGVYTLTLLGETTQNISFDATAIEVEMALESLDAVAVGEASVVDSGSWPAINETLTVTFSGALAGTDIALITVGEGGLTGDITVTEDTKGVAGVAEVWTIGINDSVTGGTFTLTETTETVPILYNATAAVIEAALEALASISAVTVTGGPGPGTDWVVTYDVTGAMDPITGDGANLTGGSATAVSITETTKGVTATGTTQITVTPALLVATTIGGSVTFGGRKLEVKVGEGNLTYTESTPREYLKNRGLLDTVRDADEEPMDVSFDFTWEFLSAVGGSATPTLKEALKRIGEASTWVSTSSEGCEPYCCNLEIAYDPACGGDNTELIELQEFRQETLEHNLRDAQISCTGKCNKTEAVETRGA